MRGFAIPGNLAGVKVLGIESSCDETAAAVVRDGKWILSNVISSQVAIHRPYGGVVPEIASRAHLRNVVPVIEAALQKANLRLDEIDGIAVTRGPGLVGALLVGVQAAKAIAWSRAIPLVGVNHLEGHLAAIFLHKETDAEHTVPSWPHLGLLVSGGHTLLLECKAPGEFSLLGGTRDDAAGEAFDKVAKMLGLGYPGGAVIDRLAKTGDASAVKLPRAMRRRGLDLSFSGMKTAVADHLARHGKPEGQALADLCASFQASVVEQLVRKTEAALEVSKLKQLQIGGGVAANSGLRNALTALGQARGIEVFLPAIALCADNAAMIASAGSYRLARGERADLTLNAAATLPLA